VVGVCGHDSKVWPPGKDMLRINMVFPLLLAVERTVFHGQHIICFEMNVLFFL